MKIWYNSINRRKKELKEIDGKEKLSIEMIKEIYDSIKDNSILISYNDEFIEYTKDSFTEIFDRTKYNILQNDEIISIATEEILIETTKKEVCYWGTETRINRIKKYLEKVEYKEKVIAVGKLEENKIINIETCAVLINQKPILKWLNNIISDYYVRKIEESLRICLDYDLENEDNKWYTIDELIEEGFAKI
mgnify:CR=1 FL=1